MLTFKKKYSGGARNKSGGTKIKMWGNAPYAPPLATRLDLHIPAIIRKNDYD